MILEWFPGKGRVPDTNDFSYFHKENVIVHAETDKVEYSEHSAPLSIKACVKGTEVYELKGIPLSVEPGRCLTINNGERYASHILADSSVVSFCIFFQDNLAREVRSVFERSPERLVDDPWFTSPAPEFVSMLTQPDSAIPGFVNEVYLEATSGNRSQLWLDQSSAELVDLLYSEHLGHLREADRLSSSKQSTRIELFRRICRARDYLESCYSEEIGLDRLSTVACLSSYHFLRVFKEAFGITPHRYLTQVRLKKAAALLAHGDISVSDACVSVGYTDSSSFARSFRAAYGCPPSEYPGTD